MIPLVNSHVLFPTVNWRNDPQYSRAWQTDISTLVTGAEARAGLRSAPRRSLTWLVSPRSLPLNSSFDDAVRAAKRTGLACAPFWGHACMLSVACAAGSNEVLLVSSAWLWQPGDYIFLRDAAGNYETALIVNAQNHTQLGDPDTEEVLGDGDMVLGEPPPITLLLSAPITGTYAAGLQAWPLLFGKFTSAEMEAVVSHRGELTLTIEERTSPQATQLGAVVQSGTGIGVFIVGTALVA
jgi:hypothetical protein